MTLNFGNKSREIAGQKKIILASASSRRREIMALSGLDFEVAPSCFDESSLDGKDLTPHQYVEKLAFEKARCLVSLDSSAVVIGADTIVVCGGRILGKPKNQKDAVAILKFCRDKVCDVLTGVAVIDVKTGHKKSFVDSTRVKMRNYSDQEIKDYIATGKPMQYAGAFAIQDRDWVESIKGSFFNVVGFPILRVLKALKEFGIQISKKRLEKIQKLDIYK